MNEEEKSYWDRQYKYVNDNINKLIEIYGRRFVIVYDSRIVDSDKDEIELAKRHQKRHGFDFSLPAFVIDIPKTLEEYLKNKGLERTSYVGF